MALTQTNLAYFHSNLVISHTIVAQLMVMNLVTQKNGVQQRWIIQGHILEDKEIGETVTVKEVPPENLHLTKVILRS